MTLDLAEMKVIACESAENLMGKEASPGNLHFYFSQRFYKTLFSRVDYSGMCGNVLTLYQMNKFWRCPI